MVGQQRLPLGGVLFAQLIAGLCGGTVGAVVGQ